MGQTLSEPVTTKHTESCQNQFLKVGSSSMQGWRINMEDSHTHILALPDDPSAAFFGVYDGHGGARIAQYAGKHLHKFITKRPEYEENKISDALQLGFMDMDTAMAEDEVLKDELAGSTAVVVLLKDKKMYCANVGDSRAIASVSGVVEPLSYDHKPNNELETKRIEAAGGWVMFNRVNGNLALSRALGDYIFKKNDQKKLDEQIVIAWPDIEVKPVTKDLEFIVLACDGIWDVMTNEEVVEFVRFRVSNGMEPEDICEDLMTRCLAPNGQMGGLGCDNMTVVIVCFLGEGRTWKELQVQCSKPSAAESNSPNSSPTSSPKSKH
ncbi:probable protein phosphatase 2C T23F11.1 [Myzus persicae]|uniref:probable protein phosphatase 2C T23F11.1 n=1 Tax=Myzus persicae TaxID=13164 RepID=UPI000B935BDB|nr:probable protein phosphatase 2C T23F11.1 [Myzus persicae]XP_022175092.1 probable protein phosphatase 2C T23F11.1 [Myzus persicae]